MPLALPHQRPHTAHPTCSSMVRLRGGSSPRSPSRSRSDLGNALPLLHLCRRVTHQCVPPAHHACPTASMSRRPYHHPRSSAQHRAAPTTMPPSRTKGHAAGRHPSCGPRRRGAAAPGLRTVGGRASADGMEQKLGGGRRNGCMRKGAGETRPGTAHPWTLLLECAWRAGVAAAAAHVQVLITAPGSL